MSQTGKKPKETDAIKAKLEHFAAYQRRIDNLIERVEYLEGTMGSPSSPNLSGMPSGGGDGTSKTERQVIKKMELEDQIRRMTEDEARERKELERLISLMDKPDEQTVIEMHYIDRAKWWPICAALYSTKPDYEENTDKYMKRTFKIHGSALQSLARIYKNEASSQ